MSAKGIVAPLLLTALMAGSAAAQQSEKVDLFERFDIKGFYYVAGQTLTDKAGDVATKLKDSASITVGSDPSASPTDPDPGKLPAGVKVVRAYLYWSGSNEVQDSKVQVTFPNASTPVVVTAKDCYVDPDNRTGSLSKSFYNCRANVTAQVGDDPTGTYTVGGVAALVLPGGQQCTTDQDCAQIASQASGKSLSACTQDGETYCECNAQGGGAKECFFYQSTISHASFALVLVYELGDQARSIFLYDGMDAFISERKTVALTNLRTPKDPTGKGAITYYVVEGDQNKAAWHPDTPAEQVDPEDNPGEELLFAWSSSETDLVPVFAPNLPAWDDPFNGSTGAGVDIETIKIDVEPLKNAATLGIQSPHQAVVARYGDCTGEPTAPAACDAFNPPGGPAQCLCDTDQAGECTGTFGCYEPFENEGLGINFVIVGFDAFAPVLEDVRKDSSLSSAIDNQTFQGDINVDGKLSPGELLRFTVSAKNGGAVPATNLAMTDDLATEFELLGFPGPDGTYENTQVFTVYSGLTGSDAKSGRRLATFVSGKLTVNLPDLLPGETVSVYFDVRVRTEVPSRPTWTVVGTVFTLTNRAFFEADFIGRVGTRWLGPAGPVDDTQITVTIVEPGGTPPAATGTGGELVFRGGGGCSQGNGPSDHAPLALAILALALILARRRSRTAVTALLVLAAVAVAPTAQAKGPRTGLTIEPLILKPGSDRVFFVEGSEVAPKWAVYGGIFLHYADDPFELARLTPGREDVTPVVEKRFIGSASLGIGLFGWMELDVSVPVAFVSQGNTLLSPSVEDAGIGDIVVRARATLVKRKEGGKGFGLGLSLSVGIPTGDPKKYLGDGDVWVAPNLIATYGAGKVAVIMANIGLNFRADERPYFNLVLGHELTYGIGAVFNVHKQVQLGIELFGRTALKEAFKNAEDSPFDLVAGPKFRAWKDLWIDLGGGAGLVGGYGTPDWRVFAGIHWSPGAKHGCDPTSPEGDPDKDGIACEKDKCPMEPEDFDGFEDDDGCPDPDNDKDGIPDVLDGPKNDPKYPGFGTCRDEPEDMDGFEDGDGCPDPDNDKDGIPDVEDGREVIRAQCCPPTAKDCQPDTYGKVIPDPKYPKFGKCMNMPEDKDGFEDGDGCPDLDNDGAGIPDVRDGPLSDKDYPGFGMCRCEPETVNGYQDEDGCRDDIFTQPLPILFDYDMDEIRPEYFEMLTEVAMVLRNRSDIQLLELQGHTDSDGSNTYNEDLSQRRVNSIVNFLLEHGVPRTKLKPVGFGETCPTAPNRNAAGKQQNRRVVLFPLVPQPPGATFKQTWPLSTATCVPGTKEPVDIEQRKYKRFHKKSHKGVNIKDPRLGDPRYKGLIKDPTKAK